MGLKGMLVSEPMISYVLGNSCVPELYFHLLVQEFFLSVSKQIFKTSVQSVKGHLLKETQS